MQPVPVQVNQFDAAGRFPDGTSSARYDCMVAAGVMELDAATGGSVRPSTTQLRARQTDQVKGIGLDDLAVAARTFGLTFRQGVTSWATLMARWRAGDGAVLAGYYAVVPAAYSSQPGGRFPHALRVHRETRPGWLLVGDPLARTAREWPASIVQRFYLAGAARAGWITNGSASSSSTAGSAGGVVLSITNATTASSCGQVEILKPGLTGIGLFPIPRDSIGQPCVECAPGYVPAIVSVGPVQTLQGYTSPESVPGLANACVLAGTKEGDRPDSGGVAGGIAGGVVAAAAAAFGGVARNLLLLTFALAALLLGLYLLATAEDGGTA